MRTRYFLIAPLVGLALFLAATPATAEGRPPEDDAYIDQDDNPTVEVGDSDDGETGDDGSTGTGDPCVWQVVIDDDFASHVYDTDGTIQYSETGRWLQKVCPGVGAVQVDGRFLIPEGGVVDVEALALQARASIGISGPVIRTSPEAGNRLYVRVPTWLWVDGGWWHGYSATASAGRVTAHGLGATRRRVVDLRRRWIGHVQRSRCAVAGGPPGGCHRLLAHLHHLIRWSARGHVRSLNHGDARGVLDLEHRVRRHARTHQPNGEPGGRGRRDPGHRNRRLRRQRGHDYSD